MGSRQSKYAANAIGSEMVALFPPRCESPDTSHTGAHLGLKHCIRALLRAETIQY